MSFLDSDAFPEFPGGGGDAWRSSLFAGRPNTAVVDGQIHEFVDLTTPADKEPFIFAKLPLKLYEKIVKEILDKGMKFAWSEEEDRQLMALVEEFGGRDWPGISSMMTNRNAKQCRERYVEILDPAVCKDKWTPLEDAIILDAQKKYGNQWSRIASLMPVKRSATATKSRWGTLRRREANSSDVSNWLHETDPAAFRGQTSAASNGDTWMDGEGKDESVSSSSTSNPNPTPPPFFPIVPILNPFGGLGSYGAAPFGATLPTFGGGPLPSLFETPPLGSTTSFSSPSPLLVGPASTPGMLGDQAFFWGTLPLSLLHPPPFLASSYVFPPSWTTPSTTSMSMGSLDPATPLPGGQPPPEPPTSALPNPSHWGSTLAELSGPLTQPPNL